MKRSFMLISVLVISVIGMAVYSYLPVKITTGTRYFCSDCGREYKDGTYTISISNAELVFGAKDFKIINNRFQPCPECTVAVRSGEKTICPDCGTVEDETKVEYVAKSEKDDYKVTQTEQVCEQCLEEQSRPGKWKHLPILLGKPRDEIQKRFGQPTGAGGAYGFPMKGPLGDDTHIPLEWTYSDDHELLVFGFEWPNRDRVSDVRYQVSQDDTLKPIAKDLLLREFQSRNPDCLSNDGNLVYVQFLIKQSPEYKKSQLLELITNAETPTTTSTRVFNQEKGVYETVTTVVTEAINGWPGQKAICYRQRLGEPGDILWCW